MTVLVAGGAGFIGSWMCERLLEEGYAVLCADNFDTGTETNVAHLQGDLNFELINHDVRNAAWTTLPRDLTHIFNFACPASPIAYGRDPIYTSETCFMGARNLALLALEHDSMLIQASTSEVYGDPETNPQDESYRGSVNPVGPRACYDEGKRVAETILCDFERCFQLKLKIARLFNTYGPRTAPEDGRVVSNFVVQALRGDPITIHGDGSQTRSFCYIDDMIEGLYRLAFSSPPKFRGPVNLGNPTEMPVIELACLVVQLIGRGDLSYGDRPIDDPELRRPDIQLARRMLHWMPKVDVSDGVSRTIEYFSQKLEVAV